MRNSLSHAVQLRWEMSCIPTALSANTALADFNRFHLGQRLFLGGLEEGTGLLVRGQGRASDDPSKLEVTLGSCVTAVVLLLSCSTGGE